MSKIFWLLSQGTYLLGAAGAIWQISQNSEVLTFYDLIAIHFKSGSDIAMYGVTGRWLIDWLIEAGTGIDFTNLDLCFDWV